MDRKTAFNALLTESKTYNFLQNNIAQVHLLYIKVKYVHITLQMALAYL